MYGTLFAIWQRCTLLNTFNVMLMFGYIQFFCRQLMKKIPVGLKKMIRNPWPWSACFRRCCSFNPSIRQTSSAGISTRSVLITSGLVRERALYDREQEGLPSLQTLI